MVLVQLVADILFINPQLLAKKYQYEAKDIRLYIHGGLGVIA
ncbi:14108_t:CDS:2 [Entrophospora sp. SA101]|nr:14108_t:CDS:2 [Entrophospora sp. SA101]